MSFTLDGEYYLTSVKVVKAGTPEVLWHLVKAGRQAPTTALVFGQTLNGLRPAADCPQVQALEPNVKYELQLAAGRHRGKATFEILETPRPTSELN